MSNKSGPPFTVFVSSDGCTESGDQRIFGAYTSWDEAIAKTRQVVDVFLTETHWPGMTAQELAGLFRLFGDVWIAPDEETFSGLGYAEKRSRALCPCA